MFYRLKLLVLLVLAFSALVSVHANNGEHSEGVITPIAESNDTRIADVETESRSRKKDLKVEVPKREPRAADTDSEDAAEEGGESESRSRKKDLKLEPEPEPKQNSGWRGRVGGVVDKIVGKLRSADTDSEDAAEEGGESESRSRKKDLKLEPEPEPKQNSGWRGRVGGVVDKIVGKLRSADTDSEDAAEEGGESESRSRKKDLKVEPEPNQDSGWRGRVGGVVDKIVGRIRSAER